MGEGRSLIELDPNGKKIPSRYFFQKQRQKNVWEALTGKGRCGCGGKYGGTKWQQGFFSERVCTLMIYARGIRREEATTRQNN